MALKIEELTGFYRTAKNEELPYDVNEVISSFRDASIIGDVSSFDQLLDAMTEAYVKVSKLDHIYILRSARCAFACFAYLADHGEDCTQFDSLNTVEIYEDESRRGLAMNLVKKVFDDRKFDLRSDVFDNFHPNPELN